MATTTYGTPYVSGTDLVANWPAASLTVANSIDAAGYYVGRGINTQTASYTGVLTDAGKTVTMSNAGATTFTVPANSSVAYPTGTRINILNLGAGACTPTAGAGVTISGTISALAINQGAAVVKTATNTWSFLPFSSGSAKATVTATTGSPTITTVGTRTVYKFTGAGSITTTAGEVEVLIVGAGSASGGSDGNGARIMTGTQTLTAATHTVAIGASGGTPSTVGSLNSGQIARAFNLANTTGAGGTSAAPGTPFTSSIDGTSRTYAAGQQFGPSSTTFGDYDSKPGVVYIAVG